MSKKPKLSIILTDAGYRESFHLLECLYNQTFKDFEVIWVDFYGKIKQPVLDYAKKFPRFKILKTVDRPDVNPNDYPNEAKSINYGIANAEGELIMKMDGDLMIKNDYIEKVVNMHKDNDRLFTTGAHKKEYKPKKNRPLTWEAVEANSYFKRPDNWGSCLTTRKEHLIACNGWDEDPIFKRVTFPTKDMGWRLIIYGLYQRWYFDPIGLHPWHPTPMSGFRHSMRSVFAGLHKFFPNVFPPTTFQQIDNRIKQNALNGKYRADYGLDRCLTKK